MIQVKLSVKEIYKLLCPKCQKKLEEHVKSKIDTQLAKQVLEGKGGKSD